MITLITGHNHLAAQNGCGCHSRGALLASGFVEITLLVVGILALTNTGALSQWDMTTKVICMAAGGFVLVIDITRATVNYRVMRAHLAAEVRRAAAEEEAIRAKGVKFDGERANTLDISKLIGRDCKLLVHTVTPAKALGPGEFYLVYRKGAKQSALRDVGIVRGDQVDTHVSVTLDFTWLIQGDAIDKIKSGVLKEMPVIQDL